MKLIKCPLTGIKMYDMPKGHYNPFAPKFIYKRKVGNITRKTTRVLKEDTLIFGQESKPSFRKRGLFPHTKPMKGWARIFIGRGRWIHPGRHKRSKQMERSNLLKGIMIKPVKRKFTPFVWTYGSKAWTYDPKLKKKK